MKTNKQRVLAAAALVMLAACSSDKEAATTGDEGRVALQVTSGIQSRAIDNKWQKDDAIGIYMLQAGTAAISEGAENRCYTATADGGTAFTTTAAHTIYFPIDGSKVDFVAYYPYQQALTNGAMTIDVSSQTDLPKIDLMTAKALSTNDAPFNKNNHSVAFNFFHKLTKIELNITNGVGLIPADLVGLTVEITNQRTSGSYDPRLEIPGVDSEPVQSVEMNTTAAGTFAQAILLPNSDEINPRRADRELVFTLKATGEKFRWAISKDKYFKAGERNIYNITINRSGVEVTATIEEWNDGNGSGEGGNAN